MFVRSRTLALSAALVLAFALPAGALSVLTKTVNIDSPLTTPVGELDFPFVHRFSLNGAKVSNSPTFTLSTGVLSNASVGVRYATNSDINGNFNEFEPFIKHSALRQTTGDMLDLSEILAYNSAANSGDLGVVLARDLGPLTLLGVAKGFSNGFGQGGATAATGLGVQLHLNRFLMLMADVNTVAASTFALTSTMPAWSVGTAFVIPYSPHSVSFYLTNADTHTLEGTSRGTSQLRGGFEFDIPFTGLARWAAIFNPPASSAPPLQPATPSAAAESAATASVPVAIQQVTLQNFQFQPSTLTIPSGTTVRWINHDPVAHSTTSDTGTWDSGLIQPEGTWSRRFSRPGTYPYHCTPHPFMHGTIVVK